MSKYPDESIEPSLFYLSLGKLSNLKHPSSNIQIFYYVSQVVIDIVFFITLLVERNSASEYLGNE